MSDTIDFYMELCEKKNKQIESLESELRAWENAGPQMDVRIASENTELKKRIKELKASIARHCECRGVTWCWACETVSKDNKYE